jgi:hypothetical protein
MTRCDHCGGKFCADCRLPPNHDCTGIGSWNAKPRPAVGMSYGKGGSVSATGGVAVDSRRGSARKSEGEIPYLKFMAVIIALIILGIAWLVLTGH